MGRRNLLTFCLLLAIIAGPTSASALSFSVEGTSASDGAILTADIVASVVADETIVIQITNTSPFDASFTDPIIVGFGFNLDEWDDANSTATLDDVGTGIDGSGVTGTATTNLSNTVFATDYSVSLNSIFPASGGLFIDVAIDDTGSNDRSLVREIDGIPLVVDVAEYIIGPVSFEISFEKLNLSSAVNIDLFASIDPVNFIVRFQSAGIGGEDSGVSTPIPEPATALLLGSGLLGLLGLRRRRFLKKS